MTENHAAIYFFCTGLMLIVSYDISDTKLRSQFSKFLLKHGRRLQLSVFECKNSQRLLGLILLTIEKKFADRFAMTDSIFIFSVCEGCMKKIKRYGYSIQEELDLIVT